MTTLMARRYKCIAMTVATLLAVCLPAGSAHAQKPGTNSDVGIKKSGPTEPVLTGQSGSFALRPFNTGPATVSSGGVVVTDTLPAGFTAPITVSAAGWSCTTSGLVVTCVYTGAAVGAHQQFPLITITGVAARAGSYINCANITLRFRDAAGSRDVMDANPRDNRSCVDGQIKPGEGGGKGYDVGIRKTNEDESVPVGGTGVFSVTVTNVGPSAVGAATGVTVTDTLPANFTAPITAAAPGWNCVVNGQVVTCVYTGSPLNAGQSAQPIKITALAASGGEYRNCAWVALNPRIYRPEDRNIKDGNLRDNSFCVGGKVTGGGGGKGYDVGIKKTAPRTVPQVGQTAQFTLNPFNTGPSSVDASTGVTVVDTVPDNFTAPITGSGNGPTWTCTTAGYVVTCVYSGPAVGAHQQLPSITISAVARHPGDYINCANIFMRRRNGPRGPVNPVDLNGIKDENPRDNRGCADGRVDSGKGGSHNVSIRKLGGGTVAQGGQITFNIDVFNLADATGPITVVDTLPTGLTNAVVPTGTPWNCTVSGNVITCVYSGAQVGHNLHFPQLNITATANSAGSFTNCAKVTINGATDSDMQDNRDCRSYEVTGRPSAKLTIVKDATPNDAQDFGFHGSGPMGQYILPFTLDDDAGAAGADNQHANSKTFTLPLGSYTITEDMTQGWTVGSIVCTPAGATVNLANRQFTLNLTNGADVTCTFNNQKNTAQDTASLTIIKDATPNDAQDFAFHGFGPNSSYIYPFTLDDDAGAAGADNQHSNSKTFPLPAGSYSITEDATSGWTLTGIVCTQAGATIDMSNRSFTLNLAAGAHVTCTFSNQKSTPQSTASITIIKVASPNDPQDFQFTGTGNGVHDFSLDDDPSDGALPNRITFNNLMPGNYSFSELPTAGWTSGGTGNGGGINCGDTPHPTRSSFSSTPSSVSIGLVAGDSVFCTVINTKQAPQGNASITIIKVASPNDPQDFQFTTSGSGVHDFSLDDDPSDGALPNSITFTHLMPGPYNFSEVATAGWTSGGTGYQGVINCQQHPNPTRSQFGPTMNSVTVYLEAGDSVVCTFINTKQQATGSGSVTIIKDAQPDNGQDFLFTFGTSGGVFALDDDGGADNTLLDHTTLPGLAAGAWTFTENAVSGWDVVAITCSPSASATTDVANRKVTINVTNGSATTCTFTNRQQ